MELFNNRVFGAVILKSINSNFNADFTTHPRTLPDGTVYATDKALKYTIKDYFKKYYTDEKIFYVKRFNGNLTPMSLDQTYDYLFIGEKNYDPNRIITNLCTCIDIKFFGATFASKGRKKNTDKETEEVKSSKKKGKGISLSIHGPLQINHAVNKYIENNIYTEDILSPFPTKEGDDASTIGNQTNLEEGHYVYHFSINPKNLDPILKIANEKTKVQQGITIDDIDKLKTALRKSVSVLDSSRKIGTDNEALIWIQLNKDSKAVLPNLTELIEIYPKEREQIRVIDIEKVVYLIEKQITDIEKVEIHYSPMFTKLKGDNLLSKYDKSIVQYYDLFSGQEM